MKQIWIFDLVVDGVLQPIMVSNATKSEARAIVTSQYATADVKRVTTFDAAADPGGETLVRHGIHLEEY